jgi:hypothetical protein
MTLTSRSRRAVPSAILFKNRTPLRARRGCRAAPTGLAGSFAPAGWPPALDHGRSSTVTAPDFGEHFWIEG